MLTWNVLFLILLCTKSLTCIHVSFHIILVYMICSAVQCLNPPQKTQIRRKPAFFSYFSKSYIKNNIRAVVFYTIFTIINVALFILSAVRYRSSNGFVIVARGCGMCLNFNCAFIVVLMLRSSLTKLRSTRAGGYLPIDQGIYIHKMVGWVVTVQSLVHTGTHLGNLCEFDRNSNIRMIVICYIRQYHVQCICCSLSLYFHRNFSPLFSAIYEYGLRLCLVITLYVISYDTLLKYSFSPFSE